MLQLTETQIRQSFINASRKEVKDITLPADFDDVDWERLDYYGFRDRKAPRRGYVVVRIDDKPVGIMLRKSETKPNNRAQCSWCRDVTLPCDVVFFSAKRAGAAGKKGDTVGTLICEDFSCSANVRQLPPLPYEGYDLEAARDRRIIELHEHVAGFAGSVRGS